MTRKASPRRRVTRRLAKRRSSTPKKPSLSKTLAGAGALTLVSSTAQAAAAQAMGAAQPLLSMVGISTGAGVVGAAVAAKAACSASKWWRDKWTGFCASWGFRP